MRMWQDAQAAAGEPREGQGEWGAGAAEAPKGASRAVEPPPSWLVFLEWCGAAVVFLCVVVVLLNLNRKLGYPLGDFLPPPRLRCDFWWGQIPYPSSPQPCLALLSSLESF